MDVRDLLVLTLIILQTVLGIPGNFFLLSHHLLLYLTASRLRATDVIIKNLIVANVLVLFSSGLRHPLTFFGLFQDNDLVCKMVPYARGVGRGVSISTTCLLSVVQAFTISPLSSRWAGLREKAVRCILPCIALCWVLSMLVNIVYPMYLSSVLSHKNDTSRKTFGKCSSVRHDPTSDFLYGALLSFPDVVFFVIMLWASGSMVCTLHRHRQRVRHLHRSSASSTSSPESRATRTILLLVSTFVCFNALSSIFYIAVSVFHNPDQFLLDFNTILTLCFPTLSPFLLLSREPKVSLLCSAWMRNIKSPIPVRNM
ncbi:Vomeronasal type-1 receptor 4 [Galemys pyrenaicus]|uniref:Vomeronasal type-1 receptor n=1 Tax=Galemys pyrenaicus TaxID=202257 RepID=A0A8J6AWE9_GALPY|nr:Vomeronasal type-1 receptor 4 [Galemys pyrenaicus]